MSIGRYVKSFILRVYFIIIHEILRKVTSVEKNKVFFISDVRENIEGNFEYIWKYLDEYKYNKVVYLKGDRRNNGGILSFNRMIYDFTTSEVILLEDYFRYTSFVRLKKEQELCQLWHACGAYKKFGYSRLNGNENIKIHQGYKKYTKVITSAEAIRENYAEAFGISIEKTKATGVPRTDIFFDEQCKAEKCAKFYEEYPELKNKKIILFAPTYRGKRAEDASYEFGEIEFESLYQQLKEEYVIIFKWHPALYNNLKRKHILVYDESKYKDFFYDMSEKREVNDLLFVADILVTDYSSVIFDYALLNKPIIYFMYDIEQYEGGRGLYYELEEYLYGPIVKTTNDLIMAIKEEKNFKIERQNLWTSLCLLVMDVRQKEYVNGYGEMRRKIEDNFKGWNSFFEVYILCL